MPRLLPCLLLLPATRSAVISTLSLTGALPYDALDFFSVPFELPPGVLELTLTHARTSPANSTNILDWGLQEDGGRFLGWGGGNTEAVVIGAAATSRSYLLPSANENGVLSGTWRVIVGKPRIVEPAEGYSINVTFCDSPTLPPQPQRMPYARAPSLHNSAQWFAGDFHVHSRESGDAFAAATVDAIAAFARSAGLDFVHLSDHNAVAAATFLVDAQRRFPAGPLLLPGVELTTYSGHGGALFTDQFVDFRIGTPGVDIQSVADGIHAQGGLFSVNHFNNYEPSLSPPSIRNACVGCAWSFGGSLQAASIDAIEIGIQGWGEDGLLRSPAAVEWWDRLHALGHTHIAPIGGSDDHHAGQSEGGGSPIGHPTTCVLAANLSHAALLEGVRLGRTAVKLFSSSDPTVDLAAAPAPVRGGALRGGSGGGGGGGGDAAVHVGGTLQLAANRTALLTASVTAAAGAPAGGALVLVLVRNNVEVLSAPIPSLPFSINTTVPAPAAGTDRWRAELHDAADHMLRVITNHIFLPAPTAAAASGKVSRLK